jgi:hypothetical protein
MCLNILIRPYFLIYFIYKMKHGEYLRDATSCSPVEPQADYIPQDGTHRCENLKSKWK